MASAGGKQEGLRGSGFCSLMMKVVACFSASGMLIYKGCGYSSYKPRDSHFLDRTSDLGRRGRGGGGYV